MSTLETILLAGYPVMGTAIAVLYRALQKSQEARLKQAETYERVLTELRDRLKKGRGRA